MANMRGNICISESINSVTPHNHYKQLYNDLINLIYQNRDYKSDIISDLRDDLELQQQDNTKLKESQMKLTNESRRLRMLQDELDSQKELILRMPIVEAENSKLKEKVNELEYYRVR